MSLPSMFQNVSTKERVSSVFSTATTVQSWSAQTDADKLMDDLFADIDRILDGSSKLPTEPIKPEYISLQSIVMPKIAMQSPMVTVSQQPKQESTPNVTQETQQVKGVETPVANSETTKQSGGSLDKILLALGLVSVGVTTALILISQKRVTWPFWQNFAAAPATQNEQLPGVDPEFAQYALRSMQTIERKNEGKQQIANGGGAGTQGNLSTLSIPGNRTPGVSQPATVLERIYYPYMIYQSPTLGGQRINSSIGTPVIPSTPAPVLRPVVPPALAPVLRSPQLAKPAVTNTPKVATSVATARVTPTTPSVQRESVASPKPRVSPTVVATPAAIASPSPAAIASPSPSPSAVTALPSPPAPPQVNHTLLGVLELGSQSAALFNIDGITQRINIGEQIGTSGWMLVDAKNGEAIIRRNGEVRSVYNGQTF